MKRIILIVIVITCSHAATTQTLKSVDSKISQVTVFLNKAQVTRQVKTRLEAGKTNLVVTHLTSQLDQQSIQVSGKGNFIILGVAHQQNFLTDVNVPPAIKTLKDSVAYYQNNLMLEQNQREILNKEEQMILSNQKIGGANQNLTAAELKAMADFYRVRLNEIFTSRIKHDEKIKKINERITKIQRQIKEQNDLFSRNISEIHISVSAEAATAAELEVSYVVSNAGWYPVYDLRAKDTKSTMQLSYKANVYQSTGEEWKNVKLKLSTANPNLSGIKPELYPWYLDFSRPIVRPMEGKMKKVMRSRAPAMDSSQVYEMEADAESIADFVNTVQTSVNTEFVIGLPYTITSTNKPTLVDIRNHDLKADFRYSVAPKLDPDAFLLAGLTGWEEFNLLPGQANVFFEGTFVANTFIDPANVKDTLKLSLGRDKRIVVKREKVKDYTSRKTIGTNQRDSYAYEISVRNTKNEPIRISIEDHVPVSQNSQIEVNVFDVGNASHDKVTGKLTWELNLQPNETKKVGYKFEVKYPKDKVIPLL